MLTKKLMHAAAVAVIFTITSCHKDQSKTSVPVDQQTQSQAAMKDMITEHGTNPDEMILADNKVMSQEGYVYTESNDATQNSILIYKQHHDGTLSLVNTVASGGSGNGTALGSQGALVLD